MLFNQRVQKLEEKFGSFDDGGEIFLDGAFGGVGDEEVVVGEGVVVTSSSLEMLTNSCLGGIMVSLIFLEGFREELWIVKHPKRITENVLVGIGKFVFPIEFIILDMPEDVNVPLILERPFLSTTHAKVDVFKRKIILRVGEEKIIFKSVRLASSLIKRVYMLSLRERMDLNLEGLMGETLILNRSFDPLYVDYIELNDLNEPQELRRNRVDYLEPTIEEGEVVNEPMMEIIETRYDFISGLDDYPSDCDFDGRIRIDYAYNLKFCA
ncbi:putative reverse transcriptase domain-containing protein [Tanacetum coccineum]